LRGSSRKKAVSGDIRGRNRRNREDAKVYYAGAHSARQNGQPPSGFFAASFYRCGAFMPPQQNRRKSVSGCDDSRLGPGRADDGDFDMTGSSLREHA
jgi:hypothetical protein